MNADMNADTIKSPSHDAVDARELDRYRALIKRLPITIRPALNGQLAVWDTLFPFERRRLQEFMRGVASFDQPGFDALTAPLRQLETKMGVQNWNFSQDADTMQNASLLARSADYLEWRSQVQRFYSAVENAAHAAAQGAAPESRIAVTILPKSLPFERTTVWKKWGNQGVEIQIDGDPARVAGLLLRPPSSEHDHPAQIAALSASDLWLIDANSGFPESSTAASIFSCAALAPLRDRVLAQVNTVPKSIEVTDQTLAAIRARNWDEWLPAEIRSDAALRKFIIDVYLSGNGALIFSNAFVEWAASEAIRRARPRAIVARFGLRAKPKPFTGIAIFENQKHINALPDVDDPQGSALDAVVLARYILLSTQRYPENAQTVFLCIAESAQSAYLVLPDLLKSSWANQTTMTPEQIAQYLANHLSKSGKDHG